VDWGQQKGCRRKMMFTKQHLEDSGFSREKKGMKTEVTSELPGKRYGGGVERS